MDGNVFIGSLGVDYRLQPTVLLGLAVAHSQGDVDITLTSVLPYAYRNPRPGLGVWGVFGAGWGDLKLRDEAGRVQTDLEMLLGAVGVRQEVLTWRQIDVALKADGFLTELEAGSDDRLPKTAGDAQQLRVMSRKPHRVGAVGRLPPDVGVRGRGRWDGGKAETGVVGAELGRRRGVGGLERGGGTQGAGPHTKSPSTAILAGSPRPAATPPSEGRKIFRPPYTLGSMRRPPDPLPEGEGIKDDRHSRAKFTSAVFDVAMP